MKDHISESLDRMGKLRKFPDFAIHQHDVECNQKYANHLPYSFHLRMVSAQARRFEKLLHPTEVTLVKAACYGHDLIEDARMTYNDIKATDERLAEIIYLCTEMRGRNREERKSADFYLLLKTDKLAVFVKLCDMMANVYFSAMSNSKMFEKYKAEYPKVKEYLFTDEYSEMFTYLDKLFKL